MSENDAIVVICAMDSEAVHLREMLEDVTEEPLYRWRRSIGRLGGQRVEIVVCGIGLAYAASATTAALIDGRPRAVINYGCAGAHRPDINAGDVVLGEHVIHLASYVHRPDDTKHYFGFRLEGDKGAVHVDSLPADPDLLDAAAGAARNADLPPWPGRDEHPTIHTGSVGSADVWTQHVETIMALHDSHRTLCEEMEAAAIAQTCAMFGVPFLAVKDISNNELQVATYFEQAEDGAGLLDDVVHEVGRRAALVVARTVRELATAPEVS